jgi:hypothetical protein
VIEKKETDPLSAPPVVSFPIPEKKLARELSLKGVELVALLEYAKDRHVIKEYGRDKGTIVFQRWPQN